MEQFHKQSIWPVAERVEVIDALRGFCFSILLIANFEYYSHSIFGLFIPPPPWWSYWDTWVDNGISILFQNKVYVLFAILFGMGLEQQRQKLEGSPLYTVVLTRRLGILFIFGLGHAVLLWYADVLIAYALCGVVALVVAKRFSTRGLLLLSIAALCSHALLQTLVTRTLTHENVAAYSGLSERITLAYRQSSFATIVAARLVEIVQYWEILTPSLLRVLGLQLLGACVARVGAFHRLTRWRSHLTYLVWLLPCGIAVEALGPLLLGSAPQNVWLRCVRVTMADLGPLVLGAGYVGGICWLSGQQSVAPLLRGLANMGKLALSNYLLQSTVCSILLFGYGCGMYGTIGPTLGLLIAIGIVLGQVALSYYWLRHFRYGPAEWLWRSGTYASWQPWGRRVAVDLEGGTPMNRQPAASCHMPV